MCENEDVLLEILLLQMSRPVRFLFLEYHEKKSDLNPFQPWKYLHQPEIEILLIPAYIYIGIGYMLYKCI